MAEEKKEGWLNYLALTTVILAVSATLATFKGQGYSTQTVRNEIKATNQWSFFQAKRIRMYLIETQKENTETEIQIQSKSLAPEILEAMRARLNKYNAKLAEWERETADIQKEARKYETLRDEAIRHAQAFGMAVIFLQIGILLSTIAALMKKKPVWYSGMAIGLVGLFYFADGFWLFL